MKIGIVGWGLEGQSAFRYFGPDNDYLIVNEAPRDDFPAQTDKIKVQFVDSPRPAGTTSNVTNLDYLKGIEDCDKIVYTPIARKNLETVFAENDPFWSKATTNQHIFFQTVKTKNIIGVTGTKGKGTTSTLIAKMLEATGKKVHFGGNVGRAVLDFVNEVKADDWVVLELANFQLYKLPFSPHIGVCLMIAPEHMDWHPDMDDYLQAKSNIFQHQTTDDIAIYLAGNTYSEQAAGTSAGIKIPYFASPGARVNESGAVVIGEEETEIIKTSDLKLLGHHNWQNVCADVTAVWQVSQDVNALKQVLASFSGLPHRLEFVREVGGVKYYDDSFGTTPETAVVALEALVQPAVLIAGGFDRGISVEPLIKELLKDRVRHVVTIGQTGNKIAEELKNKGFERITTGSQTMAQAVVAAAKAAQAGDVVLLSPAAASFDMFPNFEVRGNEFKKAVSSL